jgi:serine/threonine protein kinase
MPEHPPVPGYELLQLLGRNGHLIYLARQSSSGRLVHLRVVHSFGDFGQMVADGLRQHAALLATLDHPNILRPVEVGEARDYGFFIALEYTGGGSLADKIRLGPVSPAEATSLTRAIASAMQYARKQGVVAIDLTPGSVLLTEDGQPKLAYLRPLGVDRARGLTPGYAAPEDISDFGGGTEQPPATDVYRIGAVLYAMLSGRPPIGRGGDVAGAFRQVLEQSPAPLQQQNAAVPADLEAVCMKCLEKSPAMRYPEPGDLVGVLDEFLALMRRQAEQS